MQIHQSPISKSCAVSKSQRRWPSVMAQQFRTLAALSEAQVPNSQTGQLTTAYNLYSGIWFPPLASVAIDPSGTHKLMQHTQYINDKINLFL